MAQLNDFSKITHNGNEMGKVLHQGKTIWSSGFNGDFTKVDLWEAGRLVNGAPVADNYDARTKDFYTIPAVGLNLLSKTSGFVVGVHFYNSGYSFISTVSMDNVGNITIPSGAMYYKLTFYKGVGAQVERMNIPVFVPEANIKFNPE